jgi:hypothetical protein
MVAVTTKAQRMHMHDLMAFLLEHEPQVHYPTHDVRGAADAYTWKLSESQMRDNLRRTTGRIQFDCSQAATQVCRWAGLDDPNGLGYAYAGYTGTMLHHLKHYTDPHGAGIGALFVYGPGTGDHVSVLYGDPYTANPLLWSHGFDGGPVLIRLADQRRQHRPPVTILNISRL